MSPINRPECQQWTIKAYAKCRDLLGSNARNDFSIGWLYDNPAVYKDVDLDWEVPGMGHLIKVVIAILALAAIVILLVLFMCKVKWRPRTKTDGVEQSVQQEGPPVTPQERTKKKLNFKKAIRRRFRSCFVQTEEHARRHQNKTKKQVAVHKEHSKRKLAAWTKAREQSAQRKKEKLEGRGAKEYDRIQKSIQQG